MNTGLKVYQKQRFIEEEWADISGLGDEAVSLARAFMGSRGYVSILDLSDEDLIDYRMWAVDVVDTASSNRHPALHIFETLYGRLFFHGEYELLRETAHASSSAGRLRKVQIYLLRHGIEDPSRIDYPLRRSFQDYLSRTSYTDLPGAIRVFDSIKLEAAAERKGPVSPLRFSEAPLFLLYHPDARMARRFRNRTDKEELLFDFSLPIALLVKKQVFSVLQFALTLDLSDYEQRSRYLLPLKILYETAADYGVNDLLFMDDAFLLVFRKRLESRFPRKAKVFYQIVERIRKHLFLTDPVIRFDADIWYMERFTLPDFRQDPANPVRTLSFAAIENSENRSFAKHYLQYLLGVTDMALSSVRQQLFRITEFLTFLGDKSLNEVTEETAAAWFFSQEDRLQPFSFNRKVACLYSFFQYLTAHEMVPAVPFIPEMFYKKELPFHHDRAVPEDVISALLASLSIFPMEIRLMYLHLWCTGLRIGEICALRCDSYFISNDTAFLRVYQNKMRTEKEIPIPDSLFRLMEKYIKMEGRAEGEYIFQDKTGGAYRSGTFRKKMKEGCRFLGISCDGYLFRAHDYRHAVATRFYESGMSIQGIRDFLGHTEEDMTKQYIDYIPEKIDRMQREYFSDPENRISDKKEDAHGTVYSD